MEHCVQTTENKKEKRECGTLYSSSIYDGRVGFHNPVHGLSCNHHLPLLIHVLHVYIY